MSEPEVEPKPTTHKQQLELLKGRGLIIGDEAKALHCLAHYNYYRIVAFRGPLIEPGNPSCFKSTANFETLWQLYTFDRDLRALLSEALKRVEISLRARWAYELAHAKGPYAFEDESIHNPAHHAELLKHLDEDLARSEDRKRHTAKMKGRPPIWICAEVMSFGLLSRFYSNIKPWKLKKDISKPYQLFPDVMKSLLEHASYVRNLCAHHLYVWDRKLTVTMAIAYTPEVVVPAINAKIQDRIYNTLVWLGHMMNVIEPGNNWRQRVRSLIEAQQFSVEKEAGFPDGWRGMPYWN